MQNWTLWAIHLLLSVALVTGFTMFYQFLWLNGYKRPGAHAIWFRAAMPAAIAGLSALCALAAWVAYPGAARFYLNIAYFVSAAALLDAGVGPWGFAARTGWLMAVMAGAQVVPLPLATTLWQLAAVAGLAAIAYPLRTLLHQHYWLTLIGATGVWALYWQPQLSAGAPVADTLRALLTFWAMTLAANWLWAQATRREQLAITLNQEADHDQLTGAFSYARFRADGADAMAGGAFGLIMFDLDHFKSVNDEYGHPTGDRVLQETVTRLDRAIATNHWPARLYRTGGEEFSLLVTVPTRTPEMARAIWALMRDHRFLDGERDLRLTISVGAVTLGPTDHTILDMVRRCDASLYLSKHRGRDAVTLAAKTLTLGKLKPLMRVFAYYTAPIVQFTAANRTAGNVLAVCAFDQVSGQWQSLTTTFTPMALIDLLERSRAQLPGKMVLPITTTQFVTRQAQERFLAYQATLPPEQALAIQVDDTLALPELAKGAPRFQAAGIHVIVRVTQLDCDALLAADWLALTDDVQVDLHQLFAAHSAPAVADCLQALQAKLASVGSALIVAGIDNRNDAQMVQALGIPYGTGEYFAQPELPRM